jgi:hypothetical protein
LKFAGDEVMKCAWACRYYAETAELTLADQPVVTNATHSFIRFQPLGGVLAVMPWNFPFWQVFRFCGPGSDGGQYGTAKTFVQRTAMRARNRGRWTNSNAGLSRAIVLFTIQSQSSASTT